jgi:hypothetical protein
MTPDQLTELKNNEVVRKRLAKLMARDCFRNSTKLEDIHAAGQIDDREMQDLMIDVVDSPQGLLRLARASRRWNLAPIDRCIVSWRSRPDGGRPGRRASCQPVATVSPYHCQLFATLPPRHLLEHSSSQFLSHRWIVWTRPGNQLSTRQYWPLTQWAHPIDCRIHHDRRTREGRTS